ncbi:MAG: hypothetical protein RLZZ226_1852 [Pseudomonadota bacterium]|jgi:gamma-glutamylcyclotransferase (GGCT)/AIG2-like uncharacterized protein YtfP
MKPLYCNVFVYGTLCNPRLLLRLTGRRVTAQPARLQGARCCLLKRKHYPGLGLSQSGRVEGILYTGVSHRALAMLDYFERDFYIRKTTRCHTVPHGIICSAEVYWLKKHHQNRLSRVAWPLHPVKARGIYSRITRCSLNFA